MIYAQEARSRPAVLAEALRLAQGDAKLLVLVSASTVWVRDWRYS
jgi:hypothetical protein